MLAEVQGNLAELAWVALLVLAPITTVLIVALLRGYTIHISATREEKRRRE